VTARQLHAKDDYRRWLRFVLIHVAMDETMGNVDLRAVIWGCVEDWKTLLAEDEGLVGLATENIETHRCEEDWGL